MAQDGHPAIVIAGPTASGKSDLGLALAKEFGGEIVSSDALQVYRGVNVGTGKPTTLEREIVPHHMIDLKSPAEEFSAGEYLRLGRKALYSVLERGRLPIVVGGSGFYLKALIDGLFEGPARSDELRGRMRKIADVRGSVTLHRALARVDPASAARIRPSDISRIMRAYEIYLLTKKPMSLWQLQPLKRIEGFRWLKLGLAWPRDTLYRRIEARVDRMFMTGFVEEVRGLVDQWPAGCEALKAIGYRQIAAYLRGKASLAEAVEQTKRESRRYAKRQMTWFRRDSEIIWLDAAAGGEASLSQARQIVSQFLSSTPTRSRQGEER